MLFLRKLFESLSGFLVMYDSTDYKEQLAKIKQVISEKGKTVVDELIERKAVTKDIKAIGNNRQFQH
jgi:hypothetical protein